MKNIAKFIGIISVISLLSSGMGVGVEAQPVQLAILPFTQMSVQHDVTRSIDDPDGKVQVDLLIWVDPAGVPQLQLDAKQKRSGSIKLISTLFSGPITKIQYWSIIDRDMLILTVDATGLARLKEGQWDLRGPVSGVICRIHYTKDTNDIFIVELFFRVTDEDTAEWRTAQVGFVVSADTVIEVTP